jgi:hypothetical protein
MAYGIIIGFGVRYKSRFWYTIQILLLVRFISYTKTFINTVCQNIELYRIPKPRFYTKYQKPRFISHAKT